MTIFILLLSHKGPFNALQLNAIFILVHFQWFTTLEIAVCLFVHNNLWIFISDGNIMDLNMHKCRDHIANGCLHNEYMKQHNLFASGKCNSEQPMILQSGFIKFDLVWFGFMAYQPLLVI